MVITKIKINYYKNIKEPIVLEPHPVNIFIGQNNVGKSNFLDAIELALCDPEENSYLYYHKADVELELKFSEEEQRKYQLPDRQANFVLENGHRQLIFADRELPYNNALKKLLCSRVKRLNETALANFRQIENDFASLKHYQGAWGKFTQILHQHFPKIKAGENAMDVDYAHAGLYENDRRVTIDRLGSGFRRIFTILLYIIHPEYTVVMIDEPEIHLHPALVKKLLWAMENSQVGQIFFTTHSPLFITPITLPQVMRVVKDERSTRIFTLQENQYDYQRLLQELNADNLEMFFSDEVVLVEGISDRMLLRGLIDKFYKGDKDIKVVQTHGKGNMKIYLYLLNIFNIPFVIVLDRDALRTQHIQEIMTFLNIKIPVADESKLISELKRYNIHIFDNGSLEDNYPRRYQTEDSKSLSALRAANLLTAEEYKSAKMNNLRNIIEHL
ncbi:MAG: hypothetical protein C3F02_04900 [Parcubacteria group bacterium]|nr:MAG: hypothetical protein C3F02_04900 [Parcubacteria group bacterium]